MSINFELYKVFYYVASELSFSKAAKKLYLSQSAVSQNIHTLEKDLQAKLFLRSTKKVSLTYEGKTLFSYIEPGVNSFLQGEKQLSSITQLERGQLHIGASDTICKYYLINYLQSFHQLYPNIEILITNRTSIQCVELLEKNMVDIIVTNLPNTALDDSYKIQVTSSFNDLVIAPKTYEELRNRSVDFRTLLNYPILLLDRQSSTTIFLQEAFSQDGLTLKPAIELGSIDLLVDMATIGLGLTFIPDFVYRPHPDLIKVNLKKELTPRHLGIVTSSKAPLTLAAKAFIDLVTIDC